MPLPLFGGTPLSQMSETDSVCDIRKVHQANAQCQKAFDREHERHESAMHNIRNNHVKLMTELYNKCCKKQAEDNTSESEFCSALYDTNPGFSIREHYLDWSQKPPVYF